MTATPIRTPFLRSAALSRRATISAPSLHLALPKGRTQSEVDRLLDDAGLEIFATERGYRPRVDGVEAKRL